jgi:phosphate uptake regulator
MGALGSEMWGLAAEAYASGDGGVADLLRVRDDEIDDLHVSLTAELAAGRVSGPVAIEMALVPATSSAWATTRLMSPAGSKP